MIEGLEVTRVAWRVDHQGNLYSPVGTWIGKVTEEAIMLYDKRMKTCLPLTPEDWQSLSRLVTGKVGAE